MPSADLGGFPGSRRFGGAYRAVANPTKADKNRRLGSLGGRPRVTIFHRLRALDEGELLGLVAAAEAHAGHFLGRALGSHAQERGAGARRLEQFEALPGRGVRARVEGRELLIGNRAALLESGIARAPLATLAEQGKTPLFCALDGVAVAVFSADRPRAQRRYCSWTKRITLPALKSAVGATRVASAGSRGVASRPARSTRAAQRSDWSITRLVCFPPTRPVNRASPWGSPLVEKA